MKACSSGKKYAEKLKLIIGYDGADVPTKYFIGDNEVTKIEFAEECVRRNNDQS